MIDKNTFIGSSKLQSAISKHGYSSAVETVKVATAFYEKMSGLPQFADIDDEGAAIDFALSQLDAFAQTYTGTAAPEIKATAAAGNKPAMVSSAAGKSFATKLQTQRFAKGIERQYGSKITDILTEKQAPSQLFAAGETFVPNAAQKETFAKYKADGKIASDDEVKELLAKDVENGLVAKGKTNSQLYQEAMQALESGAPVAVFINEKATPQIAGFEVTLADGKKDILYKSKLALASKLISDYATCIPTNPDTGLGAVVRVTQGSKKNKAQTEGATASFSAQVKGRNDYFKKNPTGKPIFSVTDAEAENYPARSDIFFYVVSEKKDAEGNVKKAYRKVRMSGTVSKGKRVTKEEYAAKFGTIKTGGLGNGTVARIEGDTAIMKAKDAMVSIGDLVYSTSAGKQSADALRARKIFEDLGITSGAADNPND